MNLYVMRHGRGVYNELGLCNDDPGVAVHLAAEISETTSRAQPA